MRGARFFGATCLSLKGGATLRPQPFPLYGDWQMHVLSQLVLDHPQLRPHAVPPGFPSDQELTPAGFAADEGEAQEVEGLRLAAPALLAVSCREASELDQPGLLRVQ